MKLQRGNAAAAGIDAGRLQKACDLLEEWAAAGSVPGAALALARNGSLLPTRSFGSCTTPAGEKPIAPDSVFLVASVPKPVTATAAMILVEQGRVSLQDRVVDIIPEFAGAERAEVRLLYRNHANITPVAAAAMDTLMTLISSTTEWCSP